MSFIKASFASISVLLTRDYNPRDDLESLAYSYLYLVRPEKVPWVDDNNALIIYEKKKAFLTA
jgi:hypothetical protein